MLIKEERNYGTILINTLVNECFVQINTDGEKVQVAIETNYEGCIVMDNSKDGIEKMMALIGLLNAALAYMEAGGETRCYQATPNRSNAL